MKCGAVTFSRVQGNKLHVVSSRQKYPVITLTVEGPINTRNSEYSSKCISHSSVHQEYVFVEVLKIVIS